MFIIGIDPHKGSHTAVVVDHCEVVVATIRVDADRHRRSRLLEWAMPFAPRTWAVEGAARMGALLAQQLVAAGEHVVDVPAKLSAGCACSSVDRSTRPTPTTPVRRRSWRGAPHRSTSSPPVTSTGSCCGCWPIRSSDHRPSDTHDLPVARLALSTHRGWHRPLVDRRPSRETPGQRACRRGNHGGTGGYRRAAARRSPFPRRIPVEVRRRLVTAIEASNTTVTEVYGIGPLTAAIIVGRVGDVRRFPTAGHFARHNGTAPIEASSGPTSDTG